MEFGKVHSREWQCVPAWSQVEQRWYGVNISRAENVTVPYATFESSGWDSGFDGLFIQMTENTTLMVSCIQLQPGNSYSILYWDPLSSTWVPLKDYLLNEYRNTQVFDLFPGADDDKRKILSGVKYFTEAGEERGEVSTNFPGIFVLAQH
jgi:hypothetical protein